MLYVASMAKNPTWLSTIVAGLVLSGALGCTEQEEPIDSRTELAFPFGIFNSPYTDCNFEDVLNYLNRQITFDSLIQDGIHRFASISIIEFISGPDGEIGTDDDRRFGSIEELGDLDYVGENAIFQLVDVAPAICAGPDHPMNNVHVPFIHTKDIPLFEFYSYPYADDFDMVEIQFWQHWDGGFFPSLEFEEAPVMARQCIQASAVRFQAIMRNPPQSLEELRRTSFWRGDFINQNDDFTLTDLDSEILRGSSIYPENSDLFVWQSVLDRSGGCHLPTFDLVEQAGDNCLEFLEEYRGDLRGCGASIFSDAIDPFID